MQVDAQGGISPAELERFARELAEDRDRWEHLIHHTSDVRVYEQIWDDEDINAWVICWSEDQDTGFHDHDDSAAAIVVIDGHVREERMRLGRPPDARVAAAGETLMLPATAIHRVLHAGRGPAITIHAYSPPLRRTGAYRVGTDGTLERVSLSYEDELSPQTTAA